MLAAVTIFLLIQGGLYADPVIKEIYYQKKTTLSYPATRTFRFSLWLTETGTDPSYMVWSEPKQVSMTNAYVKTYLGDTILFDTVPVDFSQQYWVQVDRWNAKKNTWVPVGSRDRLGVVPYTLHSESGGGGGGGELPSCSYGQMLSWDGSAWVCAGVYYISNNVGIGTSSPTERLEVNGNLKMGGDIKTDRWLNRDTNTFIGVGVVGAGNLTHSSGTQGWLNTAFGYRSLYSNTIGWTNTATGESALFSNNEGWSNSASGGAALYSNTTGYQNTASGVAALYSNTTGYQNTASGTHALYSNTEGKQNTASGDQALYSNTGSYNTAIGAVALYSNTGSNNTAIGYSAGSSATTGGNNIYIGYMVTGSAGDSDVIRIGSGQTETYIAGIYGASIGTGSAVYVDSNGQLGTVPSSRRFKEDIRDMGEASSRLMNLRPVAFHYTKQLDKEERAWQYGLIAEEVAEVYPELVQYTQSGEPFTVRYHELGPMLLNEVQKQAEQIRKLTQALNEKEARIQRLEKSLEELNERVITMENPTNIIASKYTVQR
jgi:hypothetical protein